MGEITSADLIVAFDAVAQTMEQNRDALCALDGEIGDADHGVAMELGFGAVKSALTELGAEATPSDVMNTAARSFLNAVGASSGPLYATAFMRAAAAMKGKSVLGDADMPALISAMSDGIAHRGKAEVGDKTMLDAWKPAADAAEASAPAPAEVVLGAAADAAEDAAAATSGLQAKLGRAARLGERSIGHRDPGAVSAAMIIRVFSNTLG